MQSWSGNDSQAIRLKSCRGLISVLYAFHIQYPQPRPELQIPTGLAHFPTETREVTPALSDVSAFCTAEMNTSGKYSVLSRMMAVNVLRGVRGQCDFHPSGPALFSRRPATTPSVGFREAAAVKSTPGCRSGRHLLLQGAQKLKRRAAILNMKLQCPGFDLGRRKRQVPAGKEYMEVLL
ncbi:hypothetical protein AAFF_G00191450 [Aldrovandia affinis]|uniref:Uncharacterized protein n=1 Tax=Aldrovandia affinis TaxID=143900 RepID=A0AAD7RJ35_9TELE|nr:hypothetical protein AAFF_G00191450 [Aldrovandia affinis]